MNGWTAVVPIKATAGRKSRLGTRLSLPQRVALSEAMLAHVLATLGGSPAIDAVVLLTAERPPAWGGAWCADQGRGLNEELAEIARRVPERLVVLHADLPLVTPEDIAALTAAAAADSAIAPDRHLRGTNALALTSPAQMRFAFGAESFAQHRTALPDARVVQREGLALDVDEVDDLDEAVRRGALFPQETPR